MIEVRLKCVESRRSSRKIVFLIHFIRDGEEKRGALRVGQCPVNLCY